MQLEGSEELTQAMERVPDRAEEEINKVLHGEGSKLVMQNIINFMPVSKGGGRHAKSSDPLKVEELNLGFTTYAKGGAANARGSFGYLIFPNDGRGPRNPVAQNFFEKGLEASEPKIMEMLLDALEKASEI